ncbi:MAG: DNA polymerase III subunit epsilon [Alphaproteobacteria bacterium]|nr:DNA polymerase III subunit epsilon [Alphaproteobacteria bacterium]
MATKREIVLDTETTGLDPKSGHRVVEIGCVELMNHLPTGRTFHRYINPERDMPEQAFAVHGLSISFLEEHPVFAAHAEELIEFLGDAPLVIHNAAFDMGFLNAELGRLDRPLLERTRAIDTMLIARQKFPGAQASLDALCRRFEIDNSARTKHGALLDAELLAEVYLELIGAREPSLALSVEDTAPAFERPASRTVRPPRPHAPSADESEAHAAFLEKISEPIWRR